MSDETRDVGYTPLQDEPGEVGRIAREMRELRERLDGEGVKRVGRPVDDAIQAIRERGALKLLVKEGERQVERAKEQARVAEKALAKVEMALLEAGMEGNQDSFGARLRVAWRALLGRPFCWACGKSPTRSFGVFSSCQDHHVLLRPGMFHPTMRPELQQAEEVEFE